MPGQPRVENRVLFRSRTVSHRDSAAADGSGDVGVWQHRTDYRFGFGHNLFRRPVVDGQRGQRDPVEPDALEPLVPRFSEAVPGLSTVPDDGEAAGRTAK